MITPDHTYILLLIALVAMGNYLWRFLGVYFSAYLVKADGAYSRYIRLVTIAVTASMVVKMAFSPVGVIAKTSPVWIIITTLIISVIVFYLTGKKILLSMLGAIVIFYLLLDNT